MALELPLNLQLSEDFWAAIRGSDLATFTEGSCTVLADDDNHVVLKAKTSDKSPTAYKINVSLTFIEGTGNLGCSIEWDRNNLQKRFTVSANGRWKLSQYRGKWETLQSWTKTNALPTKPGKKLEVEALVLPHTAVFSVNGNKIDRFKVQSFSSKSESLGLLINAKTHVTISHYQVTEVSEEETAQIEAELHAERKTAIAQLDHLVGMGDIKQQIRSMANVIRVQQRRQTLGLETQTQTNHMVISGPPGTGKTTVARILGKILKSLGVLTKGHVVETDRGGLVGRYIGQTAPRVKEKVKEAQGGILFVDEAYMLKPQESSGKDFGQEAIDTLMKQMEDQRDDLVVIIAGYKDKLEHFLASNPGITSRFKHHFDFRDFTPSELDEIFRLTIKESGYTITDEGMIAVSAHLRSAYQNKTESFGNGRYVRNFIDTMINNMADRLADDMFLDETEVTQFEKPDVPTKLLPGAENRPDVLPPGSNMYL